MINVIPSLSCNPLFRGDSDLVAEFIEGRRADRLKSIWDFAMRKFSKVDQTTFAELKTVPTSERTGLLGCYLREEGTVLFK